MNILVTGADRGLGLSLTKQLLERGHTVFAGQFLENWQELPPLLEQYPTTLHLIPLDIGVDASVSAAADLVGGLTDRVDALICNAGITGWDDGVMEDFTDTKMMQQVYNVNAIGNVRIVEHFSRLLEQSKVKKLFFVSSEAGSLQNCSRESFYWYGMSKAALNLYAQTLYNRGAGYDVRLYHPGWIRSYMGGDFINEQAHLTPDEAAKLALDYFMESPSGERPVLRSFDGQVLPF